MSATKLRTAVIGLGMGRNHARAYAEDPQSELVGIADLDRERLAEWAPLVQGEAEGCFTDHKEMLRQLKPDLVSVALPNFLHAPIAIDCLEAGAHVLGEKPMAMSVDEALRMRDTADRCGRQLGINLSYRFSPQARALREIVATGTIGNPYHAYTKWTRRDGFPGFGGWFGQKAKSGGGPLIDLGVHRIDLALWLMNGPTPRTVSGACHYQIGVPRAQERGEEFDVEDFATGFIRFNGGASLVLEVSWGGHQEEPESQQTRVMGTTGSVIHRNTNGAYEFTCEYDTEIGGQKVHATVSPSPKEFRKPYSEMIACILEDRPFLATADDGIRIQQILDGLYRSAAEGHEVDVTIG